MAYRPQEVDVLFYGPNQVLPDRAGPTGRIKSLKNAKVRKYVGATATLSGTTPSRIQIDPRDGLVPLPSTARSVTSGEPVTLDWSSPQLLEAIGDQLLDIVGGVPRVWNGSTWTAYDQNVVVTHPLSQEVLHTSQRLIYSPDLAVINGVTCEVWTEATLVGTGTLTTTYVGFRGSTGAWLVQPTALYAASSALVPAQAKVVQDGANFWVFYNNLTSILVNVYDTNGALLGSSSAIPLPPHTASAPGTWDATACPTTGGNTVLVATVADYTSNAGVELYAMKWTGSAITDNHVTISSPTVAANGGIAFLTNDTGNGRAYLVTTVAGTPEAIWGYEITNQTITHTYNTGVTVAADNIDSVTGYVAGSAVFSIIVSYSALAATGAVAGPVRDPQTRKTVTFASSGVGPGTAVPIRTTQSVRQVSRAFSIDGNYHVVGYYQSGSGVRTTPRSVTVNPSVGDYMIGAPVQPVSVQPGDQTTGSPIALTSGPFGPNIGITSSTGAIPIQAGDTVTPVTVTGASPYGVADGTLMLRWSFANHAAATADFGGRFTLSGSSISGANTTWDVAFVQSGYFYTPTNDITGAFPLTAGGTFTATGTFQLIAMASYQVQDLSSTISGQTRPFFIGGSVTIAGAGTAGNNGTFTVARVYYGQGPNWGLALPGVGFVWVQRTTQAIENHAFSGTLSPTLANRWNFATGQFDSSYVGTNLVVSDDPQLTANVGTYPISAVTNPTQFVTGAATSALPQVFSAPLPTVAIELTTQIPYTFSVGAIVPDYTYIGAVLALQGADSVNNGAYTITQVNADGTFVAVPSNTTATQVNEAFGPVQTITIYFPAAQSTLQPTWFLVPLTGTQPVTGRFEYGSAFADWVTEGDVNGAGNFPFAVTTPQVTSAGVQFMLPYRAENVVQSVPLVSSVGQVPATEAVIESTVGLKLFTLGTGNGQAVADTQSILLPGPMSQTFTQSGIFEDGIGLAPEAPFLVSQSVGSSGTLGLTLGATYIYQPVFEYTDENGNIIESIPCLSPLKVVMSGSNNVATIGGRLAFPLDTSGNPVANTYGPLTRNVRISIYRTAIAGGIPTTQKYKITSDLAPNGLAPTSAYDPSGFSFPDSFTWNFVDAVPDVGLTDQQEIYSDSELPHYPCPAFSRGFGNYKNRDWVLAYDGSVWASMEHVDGSNVWWHPAVRWTFPQSDPPKTIAYLEDNVFVFCSRSIYQIPLGGAQLPSATGVGSLPTPISLPWPNGSLNGFALSIPDLVVYDSTAGGLWAINRSLENIWLSHPMIDALTTPITGLAVDGDQKLYVSQEGPSDVPVYDHLPGIWGVTTPPTFPLRIASYRGAFVYQDSTAVYLSTPGAAADIVSGSPVGIAPDVTFASISFANVRGQKMVWALQLIGQYLGAHRVNIVVSYPDDGYPDQVIPPFTPDPTKPYIIPFYLANEEVTSFGLRVYADFVGITPPGLSFALELIAAEIGVEPTGVAQLPDARTAK